MIAAFVPVVASLGAGIVAGLAHVWSGPDHLAVLSPYAVQHRGRAWRLGMRWGIGHAIGTLAIAAAALAVRSRIDLHGVSAIGERVVGATLVLVGLWTLRRSLSGHVHAHEHVHPESAHVHVHAHAPGTGHEPSRSRLHSHGHAAVGIGVLHGAAGGAHLWATLPALALPLVPATAYLGGYVLGSIGAMGLFAGSLGRAIERVPERAVRAHRIALTSAALLSMCVGAWWLLARRDLTPQAPAAGAGSLVAEGITIGNEILSGRTVDTNYAFLARQLEATGARVAYHQTVGDSVEAIGTALQQALKRAQLVVLTGGLGPTPDDLTRKAIAQALNRPLSLDPRILEQLRERWEQRGGRGSMPANNEQQALVPRGAETIANPVGSAPGLYLEEKGAGVFVLPGVPLEMETMCRSAIVPWVQARSGRPIQYVTVRTVGIWESVLAERIADLEGMLTGHAIAYLPSFGSVDVRVTLPSALGDVETARAHVRSLLLERLGGYVYAEGDETLESTVGSLLRSRKQWLAVAESCTGGLLCGRITSVPGSSGWFERGVVVYSNASKTELAGVPAEVIQQHGAVSEPVARALARGIAERSGTAVGVGVTGIAGPDGGTPDKPVGTVHVAAFAPEGESHRMLRLSGSRSIIRERSTIAALDCLRRLLFGLGETAKPD